MCMTNVLSKKYNSVNYHKRQFILWKPYIIFQFVLLVFNYVYISDLKLTNKRMDKNVPTFIWIKMYQHLSGILVFLIHFWTNFKKVLKKKEICGISYLFFSKSPRKKIGNLLNQYDSLSKVLFVLILSFAIGVHGVWNIKRQWFSDIRNSLYFYVRKWSAFYFFYSLTPEINGKNIDFLAIAVSETLWSRRDQ